MHFPKLVSAVSVVAVMLSTAHAEPVTIRVGWVAVISNLPSILFLKEGLAHHQGVSYVMEAPHFANTPTMVPALAADAVDVAAISYSAFALAIENAKMDDLRVIADEFQDGVPGHYSDEFMVLKDSPIRTIDDLKGKVLASNGAGGAVDMALRVMLRKHGLEDKRDLSIIEVSSPNQKAMLEQRKVDLITTATPFSQDPALRQMARTLFTQHEAMGTTQMIVWAARAGFLAKNRAAMVDFLEDTIHRGARLLPRPRRFAGPRGAAGESRHAARARLSEEPRRGRALFRPQHRPRGRVAACRRGKMTFSSGKDSRCSPRRSWKSSTPWSMRIAVASAFIPRRRIRDGRGCSCCSTARTRASATRS
jgi:sulfonate transport system substrate-binding protein